MTFEEKYQDLFAVDESYYLAHCIARDLRMAAGIAVPMQRKFNLRQQIMDSKQPVDDPTCILTGRVFNLITKRLSNGKPTLKSLEASVRLMREIAIANGVKKIAMPKIGCGLDRLEWERVMEIIRDVFWNDDIEILVCIWGN